MKQIPSPIPVLPTPYRAQSRPQGLATSAYLIVIIWGVIAARPFLVPVFISALLAFSMAPGVRFLRRQKLPELVVLIISSIVLILPFPTLGYGLAKQIQSLARDLPAMMDALSLWLQGTLTHLSNTELGKRLGEPGDLLERLSGLMGQGFQFALAGIEAAINMTSHVALILLFTILMLASRQHLRLTAERIFSHSRVLDAVTLMIERFLLARLTIVIIIATLDTTLLWIFHHPYSLLMGSFLGLMTLIPVVGFILGIIPPIIVSLATGHSALFTLLLVSLLFAMSFFEGNILSPKLVGHHLNINALSIFLGVFAGGLAWGIWGMLLSVPFLGVLRIILGTIPKLQSWGEMLAERAEI